MIERGGEWEDMKAGEERLRYYLSKILCEDIEAGQKSETYPSLFRFKGIIYQKIQVRFENEIPFT